MDKTIMDPNRRAPASVALKLFLRGGMQVDNAKMLDLLIEQTKKQQRDRKVTIRAVHLYIQTNFDSLVDLMTYSFGTTMMPSLTTMVIRHTGQFPHKQFPVEALSGFLESASGIARLSLFQMTLVGHHDGFQRLASVIERHHAKTLQVFEIERIHVLQDYTSPLLQPALDPVVKTLVNLPRLHTLMLGECEPDADADVDTPLVHDGFEATDDSTVLSNLFQSKSIKRLSLVNCLASSQQLCQIAQRVEANPTLQHLCISMREANAENIKDTDVAAVAVSMARMLRGNTFLRRLVLYLPQLAQNEDLNREIFRAVEVSKTLKEFFLGCSIMSGNTQEAMVRMLERNYFLQEFGFVNANDMHMQGLPLTSGYPCAAEVIQALTMFLRLNKVADRRRLFLEDNVKNKEWVEALINVRDDVDCGFYLLSMNPGMITQAMPHGEQAPPRTQGRKRQRLFPDAYSKRKRLYRAAKYTGVCYR